MAHVTVSQKELEALLRKHYDKPNGELELIAVGRGQEIVFTYEQ